MKNKELLNNIIATARAASVIKEVNYTYDDVVKIAETYAKETRKPIQLTAEYPDHHTTISRNEKGDTFTFNPEMKNGMALADFIAITETI